ncbi:MAG: hypothetical protein COB83_05815 [Gammaproteobacteria bacterium]|nr:MAG: hypothetical protein COB83_05815 [Gammaproteobacteria bacterium]
MLINPIKLSFIKLKAKVEVWHTADQSANDALYESLHSGYGIIQPISQQEVIDQKESMKCIAEIAKEQGITISSKANLCRKIARLAFDHRSDNRVSAIGRVWENAIDEDVLVPDFKPWLIRRGGIEGAKKAITKGDVTEPIDFITKGEEQLLRAQSIFQIDKLAKTPGSPKQVLLLANVRKDGTSDVMSFVEDNKLVASAISLIGQGKVDLSYVLEGIALEQVTQETKDKVFNSFQMLSNYTGGSVGGTSTKYAPENKAACILSSDEAELQIHVWLNKSPERPLFLFGPHGTGKSTLAKVLGKELYPNDEFKVTEMNINQSASKVTEDLKKLTVNNPFFNVTQPQIIIINEAQSLTANKKNLDILRPFLESFPKNVHVILTSNDPIIDTGINSRCLNVNLGRYNPERWQPRLKYILDQEGLKANDSGALLKLTKLMGGDIRVLLTVIDELITRYNLAHTKPHAGTILTASTNA